MTNQKLILSVVGLLVLFGIGYLLMSGANDKPVVYNNEIVSDVEENINNNVDNPPQIRVDNPPKFPPIDASFDVPIKLAVGEDASFPDGLYVTLKKINDSRCPAGAQCIWQGEISGTFDISSWEVTETKEIILGTERNKSVVAGDYIFTLKDATTTAMTILVSYKKPTSVSPCYIGGCSSQICSDQKDVISTCEYREEYACYKTAKCERQSTGQCGWTPTTQLNACLGAN